MVMTRGWGPGTEHELAALCAKLGAEQVGPISAGERALLGDAAGVAVPPAMVRRARAALNDGGDPLGDAFCVLRGPAVRRGRGATYTPQTIVRSMIDWARHGPPPARVVDPGAGSGRYLVAAGRAFEGARLIGVEVDPLAALMARAGLAAVGLAGRAEIDCVDYRSFALPRIDGTTLFAGNPPYVRHHDIAPSWKEWLTARASERGLPSSQLAGLHVYFFLATLALARPGDVGAFITASEWLDVNYGRLVRDLLAGPLGLERMDVLDPTVVPFADAQTTAVITCFRVGSPAATVRIRRVNRMEQLSKLSGGTAISREILAASPRWSTLPRRRRRDAELVELGELCQVHRGQVTGANAVWIAGDETPALPREVLRPTVTRARELFACGGVLRSVEDLRRAVDLPADLDELSNDHREQVATFLAWARSRGAHESYVARHRSPWWAVKLRDPAPLLATYMARRPPAFVRNLAGARHINVAHGLYPREALSDACLGALAAYLSESVSTADGRTYAGGLTKFEPGEMERLLVPVPAVLMAMKKPPGAARVRPRRTRSR